MQGRKLKQSRRGGGFLFGNGSSCWRRTVATAPIILRPRSRIPRFIPPAQTLFVLDSRRRRVFRPPLAALGRPGRGPAGRPSHPRVPTRTILRSRRWIRTRDGAKDIRRDNFLNQFVRSFHFHRTQLFFSGLVNPHVAFLGEGGVVRTKEGDAAVSEFVIGEGALACRVGGDLGEEDGVGIGGRARTVVQVVIVVAIQE